MTFSHLKQLLVRVGRVQSLTAPLSTSLSLLLSSWCTSLVHCTRYTRHPIHSSTHQSPRRAEFPSPSPCGEGRDMGLCGGSSMATISLVLCYKMIPQTHSHFGEAAIKGFSLFWNLSMLVRRIKGRLAPLSRE